MLPRRASNGDRWERTIADPERLYSRTVRHYPSVVALTEARLSEDLIRAMKARDTLTVSVLRGVVAAAKNAKVEKRGAALEADELVQIVRREMRKREEAGEFARKAGRADLVEQNDAEREVLTAYLPATPTSTALEERIRALVAAGTADMGAVMRALKTEYGAALDGRAASELARRVLSEGRGGS
jgi:uncharacterized protein YqeY